MAETRRTTIMRGKEHTLVGSEIKVGQKAPDFKLTAMDFSEVTLSKSRGKTRLLSVVHSIDTPVCDMQTQRFEEEAGKYQDVVIFAISMDLPFAQSRYCGARGIKNLKTLSDYRNASFGQAYGVLIEDLRLLSRAIFIIDHDDIVRYVEYVPRVSDPPDYDKAIEALEALAGKPTAATGQG